MTEPIDNSTRNWVQRETAASIDRVRESLDRFIADSSDLTPLRIAGSELRQLAGTLMMSEINHSGELANELERLLTFAAESTNSKQAESLLVMIHQGLDILKHRVDDLLNDGVDDQLGTFSIINELRAGRGAELLQLNTVFNPDITRPLPDDIETQPVDTVDTSAERRHFQEFLLSWVNNRGNAGILDQMVQVFVRLRGGAGAPAWRRLWWVAEAFTTTRDDGGTLSERSTVSLFRRLDQHIRRFDEAGSTADIDDDLVTHLLFAILLSDRRDGIAGRIVECFDLANRAGSSAGDTGIFTVDANQPSQHDRIHTYLAESRSDIEQCTSLIQSMMEAEPVPAQSLARFNASVSQLDSRRKAYELGLVGALVVALKNCVDDVSETEIEFSQDLRMRSASGLFLLTQLANREIALADSKIELSSTIEALNDVRQSLHKPVLAQRPHSIELTATTQWPGATKLLSTPLSSSNRGSASARPGAAGMTTQLPSESDPDVEVIERQVEHSVTDHSRQQVDRYSEDLAVASRSTQIAASSTTAAGDPPKSTAKPADAPLKAAPDVTQDIEAVVTALRVFSQNHIDVDSLAAVSGRMDAVVGFLDDKGHTNAGDVFDYCRRIVAGLIAGRLDSASHLTESVEAGIEAVGRHISVSRNGHMVSPDDLQSLTDSEQLLRDQLAAARARLVPLDTMRQNLMDFMVEWRQPDASRDDWRNFRIAIDDIGAFADLHQQQDIGQRAQALLELAESFNRRLSNPEPSDIEQLNRARDVVLVALARLVNQLNAGDGQLPVVETFNEHKDSAEQIEAPEQSEVLSDSVATEASPASKTILNVLDQIKNDVPKLETEPDNHALQSELMLGLLLIREKGESNGLSAVADVARVSEKLLNEVANGVVSMNPFVTQFVTVACDRLEQLARHQPAQDAVADIDAWKQASTSARAGQEPFTALGPESIFIDDLLVDESPLTTQSSTESEATSDAESTSGSDAHDTPEAETVDAGPEPASGAGGIDVASLPTLPAGAMAMSAGALVQQVLANSGMDLNETSRTKPAEQTNNDAEIDQQPSAEAKGADAASADSTTKVPAPGPTPDSDSRLSAPRPAAQTPAVSAAQPSQAQPSQAQPTAAAAQSERHASVDADVADGRRAEGENIDVLIGEAMAHTAYLGQWLAQEESAEQARAVGEDLAGAVDVLRAITRVIGVDSIAALFEPLHGLLELLRKESLPVSSEERQYIRQTGRLADAALVVLAENRSLSESKQQELRALAGRMDARLLQLEAQVAEQGSQHQEQIAIKIIGEDLVTLEQLAGGLGSDQLDLDRLFREESTELFRRLREATTRWREEKFSRDARSDLLHEFHTLKGNARTAGFPEAAALAHSLETLLGQQNPNNQGEGLHGEEVVIYLNQAAAVLTEFIEQPDSERSRASIEGLKRRVDAQCFIDSETTAVVASAAPGSDASAVVDAEIETIVQEQKVKTRDLATVAATSYAYDGFTGSNAEADVDAGIEPEAETKAGAEAEFRHVNPAAQSEPQATPPAAESERTLPVSLMAPATIVAESGTAQDIFEDDVDEFEIRSAKLVQPTKDIASATSDLVEKVADHMGDIHAMSRSLSIDLATLGELTEEFEGRQQRVIERLGEFETSSMQLGVSHVLSRTPFDDLRDEIAGMGRLRDRIASVASQLGVVINRHDDRVATLRRELKNLRGVAFESIAPRLRLVVRQSSSDLMKETRFVLRGGEVEIDRYVLDSLLGSLENLLRNAVVHGIEFPERRRQASKATTGTVQVSVRRDEDQIVIEVSDDGAGIDYMALLESIRQAEDVNADIEAGTLERSDITERMFDAGVTTAKQTTELAGRGVGLEVVRKTVRLLGGDVDVRSETGRGSAFIVRLPAQAESIKARIIESREFSVAIAEHHVRKSVSLRSSQVEQMIDNKRRTLTYEGWQYPFVTLREILKIDAVTSDHSDTTLNFLLLNLTHGDVALQIDGSEEVAHVVRQPRLDGRRKPAMVLTTLASIDWLEIDALWNRSSIYSLSRQAQLAFHASTLEATQSNETTPSNGATQSTQPSTAGSVSDQPDGDRVVSKAQQSVVVFVADHRDIAPELITGLDNRDITVAVANRSSSALELLDSCDASAIVVDLDLPGGDGFELVHQLNKMECYAELPTIVVSSIEDDFRRKRLDSLKVTELVAKPCDNDLLIDIIGSHQRSSSTR